MQERLALQQTTEEQGGANEKCFGGKEGTRIHCWRKANNRLLQAGEGSFKDWTQFVHAKNKFMLHFFNITYFALRGG